MWGGFKEFKLWLGGITPLHYKPAEVKMVKNRVVIFLGDDKYKHKRSFIYHLSNIMPRNIPLLREYTEICSSSVERQSYLDWDILGTTVLLLRCNMEGFNILVSDLGCVVQFEMLLSALYESKEVVEVVVVAHKGLPLSLQEEEIVESCGLNNVVVHWVNDYNECDYLRK